MSQKQVFTVQFNGATLTASSLEGFTAMLAAVGLSNEPSPSVPEVENASVVSPDNVVAPVGWYFVEGNADYVWKKTKAGYVQYRRVSDMKLVAGSSIGKAATASKASSVETQENGFYSVSVAGQVYKFRLASGKLRNGDESTILHFAESTKDALALRNLLKANAWRFNFVLTRDTPDSKSSWFLNTPVELSQITDMLSD